ncbi:MAG: porin family protein [Muribaculaceae bacterium]|nr:porin family protein [Muribaculaceae bacterium]
MKNFKKVILTLLVAILGMGAANAQLRFGVKAGLNLNSLHFSGVRENLTGENKAGFTGGLMTEFQIPVIGLCFDLSAMYTHMSNEVNNGNNKVDLAKNFLEVPINVKYKIGLPVVSNIVTPFIFTGPSFAFRLGKVKKANPIQTKSTQAVWNLGIGVELIHHLQIQGGYGFGINNVLKTAAKIPGVGDNLHDVTLEKLRNNYWTITAAWLF